MEENATTQVQTEQVKPVHVETPEPQVSTDDIAKEVISDPFEELDSVFNPPSQETGDNQETGNNQETVDPDPVTQTEPLEVQKEAASSKEDDSQFQYWQSEADKRSKELNDVLNATGVKSVDEFNSRYSDFQTLAPIADYIRKNPDILDSVEQSLSNNQPAGQTQAGDQQASLKKPEKPIKPANYDPMDAVSDPESASFKHRETVENYNEQLADFYESQNIAIQSQYQKQQQEATNRSQMQMLRTQLTNSYEFSQTDMESFINEMSDPNSLSLDNLVQLWKIKNSATPEQNQNNQKVQQMQRQKEKLTMSTPVGVQPGGTNTSDRPIEDRLMDTMIGDFEKQNPWT